MLCKNAFWQGISQFYLRSNEMRKRMLLYQILTHWRFAQLQQKCIFAAIEFLLCKNSILIFFTLCFYEVKTLKTKRIWCIKYFNLLHFASCVFVCFHNGYAKMYFCVTKEQNVQQHNYAVRSWCLCVILQSKMYEKEIWCKNAFLQSNAQPP